MHQFGRSINAQVNPKEPELFEASSEAFENERTLDAYDYFLTSIQNFNADIPNNNISITKGEETLDFELFQGSAKIVGHITPEVIEAHCLIAGYEHINVAVKRRLLERNYQLTYTRFYTKDKNVWLKIYLDNTTMTPQKIFFPLRELALNADYEKEYIASEFNENALLDIEHIRPIPIEEKELKYRFMQRWITECEESIKRLPTNDNAGMHAFTYLTLLLQIDYLVVPKKQMGQKIVQNVSDYFNDDEKSVESKNLELSRYIASLNEMPFERFASQLYLSAMTFSPMERATHEEVATFIEESLGKVRWYKNNRYTRIILTIYRYIALYLLYNYGLHPSTHALLHLIVEIHHGDFFEALGYTRLYDPKNKKFDKRRIVSRIETAIVPYQKQFKQLTPFGDHLDYSSLESFSHGFYLQIKHLNYTEL